MRVEAKYVKRRNLIPFLTPELAKTIKISKKSDVKKVRITQTLRINLQITIRSNLLIFFHQLVVKKTYKFN